MAQIEMTLEKSIALLSNENASNDLRAIGALSAASLLLHRMDGECPVSTFGTIESLVDHANSIMAQMDETHDDTQEGRG